MLNSFYHNRLKKTLTIKKKGEKKRIPVQVGFFLHGRRDECTQTDKTSLKSLQTLFVLILNTAIVCVTSSS